MSKKCFLVCISLFLFLVPLYTTAVNVLDVVINEICWMGTENSYNDEWIELYNNSSFAINLEGWKLLTQDGTPEINLIGKILSKGFFILERTDDTTLPDIKADLIYKGGLTNKGENLKLIDSQERIIDAVDCSSGWFTGENNTKQTMERKNLSILGNNSEDWQTSQNPGGTPKAENSTISFNTSDVAPIKTISEIQDVSSETNILAKNTNKKELAVISETVSKLSNPWWIFLIAVGTTIFSTTIVLLFKLKINKKH